MSGLGGGKHGQGAVMSGGCTAKSGGWGHKGSAMSMFCAGGQLSCWGVGQHVHGHGLSGVGLGGMVALASGGCWCGLTVPGRGEVTAMLGDTACLGLLGRLSWVVVCGVRWVVGCGAGCDVLAIGVWDRVAVVVMG
jgi:hypothetical protein